MAYTDPNAFKCKKCGRVEKPYLWRNYAKGTGLEPGYCFQCSHWARLAKEPNTLVHRTLAFTVYEDYSPIKTGQPEGLWEFHLFDGRILVASRVAIRGGIPSVWHDELPNTVRAVFSTLDLPVGQAKRKEIPETAEGVGVFFNLVKERKTEPVARVPLVQATLF